MSGRKQLVIFLFFLFIIPAYLRAQLPAIDAIKQKAAAAKNSQQQLAAIMELLAFRNSLNADTAKFYFSKAKEIAATNGDIKNLRKVEYALVTMLVTKGETDSVITRIEKGPLFDFKKEEDPDLYFKLMLLKANALNRMNERPKALELQLNLLTEAEKDNNILAQCYLLNYLGATYINSNQAADAVTNWFAALELIKKNPSAALNEIETTINSNLIYYYYGFIDSARNKAMTDSFLFYTNKVINSSRQNSIYWLQPTALSFRGDYYSLIGKTAEGEKDFKEAVEIRNKIGDPLYTANDLIHFAAFYSHQKKYDSTIKVLQQALTVIKKGRLNELSAQVLGLLSYAYKQKGDYKAYSLALEQFILDADTANRLNAADKIAAITAKYDVQKKEATITNQKLQLAQRLNYIIAALFLIALIFPLVFLYLKKYKKQQKIKNDTAILEAEDNERKRIAAELHDNMGVQANAILHNSSLLADNNNSNEKIVTNLQDTAKEMLGNLRETVWALKTTEVTCAATWLRLINFIKQVKQNFNHINFEISGESPGEKNITSVKALHIVMVVKEAVNNAVKHAAASTITVTTSSNVNWTITVTDNGKGFNIAEQQHSNDTNGLINMQQRAAAGNFEVTIHSENNNGTAINLKIPV